MANNVLNMEIENRLVDIGNGKKEWHASIFLNSNENAACYICGNEIKTGEIVYIADNYIINCTRNTCMKVTDSGRYPKILDYKAKKAFRAKVVKIRVI